MFCTSELALQKLKDKEDKRELQFEKPINYSKKVLIGHWWYKDVAQEKPNSEPLISTIQADYVAKPIEPIDKRFKWDHTLKQEDSNFISQTGLDRDQYNFFRNYASSYDLSYNHFPNCLKNHKPKNLLRKLRVKMWQYTPIEEYLESYGNVTNYGLRANYEEQWKKEQEARKNVYTSETKESFQPFRPEDYKTEHWITRKWDPNYLPNKWLYDYKYNKGKKPERVMKRGPPGHHPLILSDPITLETIPPCLIDLQHLLAK